MQCKCCVFQGGPTLAGLADQSRQRQGDQWGAQANKPSDPWGTQLPAPPGTHLTQLSPRCRDSRHTPLNTFTCHCTV